MSIDNLSILHSAAALSPSLSTSSDSKLPKLPTMTLRDPSKYSPQGGSPLSTTPTSQSGFEHRPAIQHSQSFSLPPIRELLKDTSGSSTPATHSPALVLQHSAPTRSSMPQLQPPPQPQPQQQQQSSPNYFQPQAQAFHLNSSTPPPPPPYQLGRSSSLPNYLTQQGRVPSPGIQLPPTIYQNPQPQQPGQYPVHHVHIPSMMPTPESRSRSTSPVSSDASSMYGDVNKEGKLNSRKKRQNLPRQTTLILLSWLSEHLDRPYPNSREKYELLMKTRLTIQQLDNWFINARRRKINHLRKLKENDQSIALMF